MEKIVSFAEKAAGVKPPPSFILDASVTEMQDEHKIIREDVKQNRVEYEFPDGLNKLDLFEECRALTLLDDFDVMYDVTSQMLTGKSVIIRIKNYDGTKTVICQFQVVDRFQNLRAIETIDEYPCLITWLTEFIGALLLKKFPVPGKESPPQKAPEKKGGRMKKKKTQQAAGNS